MPKAEWGVKRVCTTCRARFYDLMRTPIVCPSCGAELDMSSPAKPKRVKPGASEKTASAAPATVAAEDLIDDEDELGEDLDADALEDEDDEVVLDDDDDDEDDVSDVGVSAAGGDDEDTEIENFDGEVILEDDDDVDLDDEDDDDEDDKK